MNQKYSAGSSPNERAGSQGSGRSSNRPAPPKQNSPVGMIIMLIVSPAILLGAAYFIMNKKAEEKSEPKVINTVVDNTQPIKDWRAKKLKVEMRVKPLYKLVRDEEAAADTKKSEIQNFKNDCRSLQEEFAEIMKAYTKADGTLEENYSGYGKDLNDIQQWLNDLGRISGF